MKTQFKALFSAALLASGIAFTATSAQAADREFLNVSYDATREFYDEFNKSFGAYWKERTGRSVNFKQSHGGSGKQARSVIDGLQADVVTLALANDIDEIVKAGLIHKNWQKQFPNNSAPYTSTVVFLVRKGNPKQIKDWGDLTRDDISIITPNPKTSGGARWNYLAAWGYALKQSGSEAGAKEYIRQLYQRVKVLDSGARGATTSFVERGLGDVLLAWENEAYLVLNQPGARDQFELVTPSLSILAEPPVAVVNKVAQKHGTEAVAKAYLEHLYSPEGQIIAGKHYYRPTDPTIAAQYAQQFAKLDLFTVQELEGNWDKAQKKHFARGGVFDQIVKANSAK